MGRPHSNFTPRIVPIEFLVANEKKKKKKYWSRTQSGAPSGVQPYCLLPLCPETVPPSLPFVTFTFLKSMGPFFLRQSFSFGLSNVFLWCGSSGALLVKSHCRNAVFSVCCIGRHVACLCPHVGDVPFDPLVKVVSLSTTDEAVTVPLGGIIFLLNCGEVLED